MQGRPSVVRGRFVNRPYIVFCQKCPLLYQREIFLQTKVFSGRYTLCIWALKKRTAGENDLLMYQREIFRRVVRSKPTTYFVYIEVMIGQIRRKIR